MNSKFKHGTEFTSERLPQDEEPRSPRRDSLGELSSTDTRLTIIEDPKKKEENKQSMFGVFGLYCVTVFVYPSVARSVPKSSKSYFRKFFVRFSIRVQF